VLPTSDADSSSSPQLPTPRARDSRGKGFEDQLPNVVALLKTPTAQLAVNGGSQHPEKRKAGGHGPTLADEVEHLLPTPRVAAGRTGRSAIERSSSSPSLEQAVELANGETPRELERLEKVPPSWSGVSSPRRSRGGKRRPAAVPPGQLTIEAG
jgi:hypothetical protein